MALHLQGNFAAEAGRVVFMLFSYKEIPLGCNDTYNSLVTAFLLLIAIKTVIITAATSIECFLCAWRYAGHLVCPMLTTI